ncbi:MAG: glycosyl transferase, partial [Candidatus Atelocyanobacterium thalassa isolate SIO64986]
MLISIVIPCYNEQEVIQEAHNQLVTVLSNFNPEFELVYVDDGSQDKTAEILRELQYDNEQVKVIFLSRNFGHQMAVTAGLDHTSGDAVVLIDADLQDPPEIIKDMLSYWFQ